MRWQSGGHFRKPAFRVCDKFKLAAYCGGTEGQGFGRAGKVVARWRWCLCHMFDSSRAACQSLQSARRFKGCCLGRPLCFARAPTERPPPMKDKEELRPWQRSFPYVLQVGQLSQPTAHEHLDDAHLAACKIRQCVPKVFPPNPELRNVLPSKPFCPMCGSCSNFPRKLLLTVCIAFDPYSYTRGHWLDRDEQRRKARRLDFNFDALLDVAVNHSEGAREVVACEKREGGFNRVFIIEFDNGAKVVAKVPMQYAGPTSWTTLSEVATMKYGI